MTNGITLSEDRISKRNLWGYPLTGVGRDMAYSIVSTFLMMCILLTKNVNSEQFAWIGVIMILCRIFDGCNDPLMGVIIEKTRSKIGKFKPWILAGALTNALVIFFLFWVPLKGYDYVIFFAVGYLLWGITYTMNDISYWGMLPSLTSNEGDRNNLTTIATACAGVGAGIITIIVPVITIGENALGGSPNTAYPIVGAVVPIVFVICQVACVFIVKEKPQAPVAMNVEKQSLGKMFKVLFSNKQTMWVALSLLIFNVAQTLILNGLVSVFIIIRFGYDGGMISIFTTLFSVAMAVIVIYPFLAKKFTRKQITRVCMIAIIIGYSLMLVIGLTVKSDVALYILPIVGSIAAMGQAVFYTVLTLGIANSIEYNEWKFGTRDEGMIFAVRPFMAKLGSALQMGIVTAILTAFKVPEITNEINFIERDFNAGLFGTGAAADAGKTEAINKLIAGVDPDVALGLIVLMTIIPMVLMGIGIVIYLKKSKVDEKAYEVINKDLALRKAGYGEFAYSGIDGDINMITKAECNEELYNEYVASLGVANEEASEDEVDETEDTAVVLDSVAESVVGSEPIAEVDTDQSADSEVVEEEKID